ncbi:MAG: hypothetical protein IKT58_07255 [Oscillospiraceae bacterium]|nr:hypothetical protein [Oscillospiraceae bacterium]
MRSRASCFNLPLIRKNLGRFWPLMLILSIFFLISNVLGNTVNLRYAEDAKGVASVFYDTVAYGMTILYALLAMVCASCTFDYLHKTRSSHYIHSLPVDRTALFCSGYLSGIALFVLPLALTGLLGYGILASRALLRYNAGLIFLECMAFQLVQFLFYYSLAVLAQIFCGRRLHAVIFYALLLLILPALELVGVLLVAPTLFGVIEYYSFATTDFCPLIYWMDYDYAPTRFVDSVYVPTYAMPWKYSLICLGVSLGILILGLYAYRKRKGESTGLGIALAGIRSPLHLFLTLIGGEFLAAILMLVLQTEIIVSSPYGWLAMIVLCSVISFFLIDMLLRRTKKVFQRKNFLRFGMFALGLVLVVTVFRCDLFHVVRRVPRTENIASVEISFGYQSNFTISDPEDIEVLTDLHRRILDNRKLLEQWEWEAPDYSDDEGIYRVMQISYKFTYILHNGREVVRSYELPIESQIPELQELYNSFNDYYVSPEINKAYVEQKLQGAEELSFSGYVPVSEESGKRVYHYVTYTVDVPRIRELMNILQKELEHWEGSLLSDTISDLNVNDTYTVSFTPKDSYTAIYIPESLPETYAFIQTLLREDYETKNADDFEPTEEYDIEEDLSIGR